jgi:hypothetical protein
MMQIFLPAAFMTFEAPTATSSEEPFAVCSLIDEVRSAMISIGLVIESAVCGLHRLGLPLVHC